MKDAYKKRFWGCPRCKGVGQIELPLHSGRFMTLGLVWIKCPMCKGHGNKKEDAAK